ncbi:hypothetical protein MWU52_11765 [Jannaschia sp. S6380]|uniref:PIN-like domain-containing protein n=1 Tax=Jannaschia sp. S6380 TaxID=2926408 RepID=UPI001FF50C3C|nr:hypothetical protein [Jannaschia sp. S6380]MCK0168232.1 hypothetical protein [Jannaschia sp. S6380]
MAKVLFDHNMPPALARGLHEIISKDGHEAFALRDKFRPDILDVEYFDILGRERGWIVISKDLANSKKKAERAAIMRNRIIAFYLSPALQRKPVTKQAASVLWHWEGILEMARLNDRGLFQLSENKGKFRPL